jgi:predicted phosphodiesterase
MRYALISDLHANLQAWKAVELDIRSHGVDTTICLGDVVGYGPNPAEVLQAVHKEVNALVLGNHDAVVCGKLDDSLFNDGAQECIRWTRAQLGANAVRFLGEFPLTLVGPGFRCAHGEFTAPGQFDYVFTAEDALSSWKTVNDTLLFVGHTHDPALFLLGPSGVPRTVEIQDFTVEPDKRYFVNVGSAGHPRDGDPRASYCIYDTDLQSVFWRRVPFDLDAYRDALIKVGRSTATSHFLTHDPRLGRPPLREMINFSPPRTADKAARNTVEVRDITMLKRRVRTWRLVAILVILASILSAGTVAFSAWRDQTRALLIEDPGFSHEPAAQAPEYGARHLALPAASVAPGRPWPGWRILLGNRHRQRVEVVPDDSGSSALVITSETLRDEICLSAEPVRVTPGTRVYPEALFLKTPGFEGHIAIVVSLTRQGEQTAETISHFYVKEPNQSLPGGWLRAKQKFDVPARGTQIQFHIRGTFTGQVRIKGLSLTTAPPSSAKKGEG